MGGDDPDPPKEPPAKRARPDPGASEATTTDEVQKTGSSPPAPDPSVTEIFYTSRRFGRVSFYAAPHRLLKRTPWHRRDEVAQGKAFWEYCSPVIKDAQLFIGSVHGHKLPENFSFVEGLELKLAGCARPELEGVRALALLGGKLLITLSEESPHYLNNLQYELSKHHMDHVVVATPNGGAPSLADMERCVARIRQCVEAGGLAVVHCHAGEGRTGCLLAAYLCRVQGMAPPKAIAHLRTYRHRSLQGWCPKDNAYGANPVQVKQLELYAQQYPPT